MKTKFFVVRLSVVLFLCIDFYIVSIAVNKCPSKSHKIKFNMNIKSVSESERMDDKKTDDEKITKMTTSLFHKWLLSQTIFHNLILYAYLFWWLFLMFTQNGFSLDVQIFTNALVLAMFVFIALNSAAYSPPMFGPNGYSKQYFKIARFFLIPFCVSSISVVCKLSDDCQRFFPTNPIHLMLLLIILGVIIVGGSVAHYLLLKMKL